MKKMLLTLLSVLLSASALAQVPRSRTRTVMQPNFVQDLKETIVAAYGAQASTQGVYIGSEFCLACHPRQSTWRNSLHAKMHASLPDGIGSMDPALGVIFDANRNGIDDFKDGLNFNEITSAFDPYKPNAPKLSYVAGEPFPYRVTIGSITYKAMIKQGGYFQQRLITRIPVSDGAADGLSRSWYMLPFAYSPKNHSYALYNADKWWDAGGIPKISAGMNAAQVAGIGRSWTKACIGCHVTGYTIQKASTGEWTSNPTAAVLFDVNNRAYMDLDMDGKTEFAGVGCESCHGPGSLHVLGGPDPSKILNPSDLTKQQQVWLCAQCHTRGLSVPGGLHDFAYDETADRGYQIGDNVWNYYHDEAGRWADGKTPSKGEQQFQAHEVSAHFTNPYHTVLCSDCHDPHSAARFLPRTSVTSGAVTMATSFYDNTLCLSCHATHGPFKDLTASDIADPVGKRDLIARVVSTHTHHPYAPERIMGVSRCTTCHMARTAKRDWEYDETSHTMEAISPEKTVLYQEKGGMPSSCAGSCHSTRVNDFDLGMDPTFKKWNEAFDVENAKILMRFFGPGGSWWDTKPAGPASVAPATDGRPD